MPEFLEPLIPGECYHIYNRSVGNEDLFKEEENYLYFLKKFKEHLGEHVDVYAYCLMPNHFHFFVFIKQTSEVLKTSEVSETPDVSKKLSNLFNAYTKAYNKRYGRHGTLFNHRFKRKAVSTNEYFIQVVRYIHFNPVNHGFTEKPEQWKFSSYNSFFHGKETNVKTRAVIEKFDDFENFKYVHSINPGFDEEFE